MFSKTFAKSQLKPKEIYKRSKVKCLSFFFHLSLFQHIEAPSAKSSLNIYSCRKENFLERMKSKKIVHWDCLIPHALSLFLELISFIKCPLCSLSRACRSWFSCKRRGVEAMRTWCRAIPFPPVDNGHPIAVARGDRLNLPEFIFKMKSN